MKQKGISTVIATILMLMIAIALAGSAYMFISGVFTARISTTFSIVDTFNDTVTIRNDGTVPIFLKDLKITSSEIEWSVIPLKKVNPGSSYNAAQAENYCNVTFGNEWHLYVPRSQSDLNYAWVIAHSGEDQHNEYLGILGIYPKSPGATCVNTAMKSETCINWRASDDGKFWVSERTDIGEPNGDNCLTGSMYYWWNADGTLSWYNDVGCPGYTSSRFLCQQYKINPGSIATLKIHGVSEGTHTLRLCTPSMCQTGYLTII